MNLHTFLIFGILFSSIFAYEAELNFADSLFASGYYKEAITTYQRFTFYNFASPMLPYARYKLALSYIKLKGEKEKSKGEGILKELASRDDEIGERARISLIKHYLREDRFSEANLEIDDFLLFTKEKSKARELNRLKSILKIKGRRIKEAKDICLISADTGMLAFVKDIRLPKSERLAPLLSAFIPGLGEIYSGKYRSGLLSFLVNSLCGYGIYYSLKEGRKMDAILIFSFLFLRFYQGSIQNAAEAAWEYNENYLNNRLKGYLNEKSLSDVR